MNLNKETKSTQWRLQLKKSTKTITAPSFNVIALNPRFIALRKFYLIVCLISIQVYFWCSVNKCAMNFAQRCILSLSFNISSATFQTANWLFFKVTAQILLTWPSFVDVKLYRLEIFNNQQSVFFLITQSSVCNS